VAVVEDLDAFLADFGVACVFGAQQFVALPDQPDELMNLARAGAHSTEYLITYRTDAATLTRGDAGTVGGVAYTVREAPRKVDDGAFSRVLLTKA
jgi:hypothetical protein